MLVGVRFSEPITTYDVFGDNVNRFYSYRRCTKPPYAGTTVRAGVDGGVYGAVAGQRVKKNVRPCPKV